MGNNTEALGGSSTALGSNTEASGFASIAMGSETVASGDWSTAMGNQTTASASSSTAMGFASQASGWRSTAMGFYTIASGQYAMATGYSSEASGYASTSTGYGTRASGEFSIAMGFETRAESRAVTALGRYNIGGGNPNGTISTDPLFEIGNGSDDTNRSNALTVLKNGYTGIGTHTPQERLHIANGRLRIGSETIEDVGSNQLSFNATLLPDGDNSFRLGNSNNRWVSVWAADGTINTSDKREKKNIKDLQYGLHEILQMQPVSFNWKNENNPDIKLGLIAQDLRELVPEVVKTHVWEKDEISGRLIKIELSRLGVYYSDLVPVLINAIKQQQELISNHGNTISKLESELNALKESVELLKSELKTKPR